MLLDMAAISTAPENGEVWVPVVNFPQYEVSNTGRVRSPRGILTNQLAGGLYLRVQLWSCGRKVDARISALVCEAFNGPKPFPEAMCLHRDDNQLNNRSDNLYWGTSLDNAEDRKRNQTYYKGESHPRAKLTWEIVRAVRAEYKRGTSQMKLQQIFGIAQPYISEIVRNRVWIE